MDIETLHFRIGEDFGRTLMQIAHEHFVYKNDFDKAMDTLNLGEGCDEKMQIQLLSGEKIILVDEKKQEFNVVDRVNYPELDNIYPKIDILEYTNKLQKDTDDRCVEIESVLNKMVRRLNNNNYLFRFNMDSVISYIYGDDEVMLEEIHDDAELNQYKTNIRLAVNFIEAAIHKIDATKKFLTYYPEKHFNFDMYYISRIETALQKIANKDMNNPLDDKVDYYIKNAKEINNIMSKGIEPVDIMDNYSAGWLSPEGDYYALNGDIANLLHIQIANSLQEKGIIPQEAVNPYTWLEQNGWVAIHKNNVQFAGCTNYKIDKPNVHMTNVQKEMIYKYTVICHNGIIKAGWKNIEVSAIRFKETDNLMLCKNYFDF